MDNQKILWMINSKIVFLLLIKIIKNLRLVCKQFLNEYKIRLFKKSMLIKYKQMKRFYKTTFNKFKT